MHLARGIDAQKPEAGKASAPWTFEVRESIVCADLGGDEAGEQDHDQGCGNEDGGGRHVRRSYRDDMEL